MSKLMSKVGRSCKFDPSKDFVKVESGLVVSLSEALKTGVVKDSGVSLDTNGIDDPESVLGRVKDRFDAIEASRAIRKYGKKADISSSVEGAPVVSGSSGGV